MKHRVRTYILDEWWWWYGDEHETKENQNM